MRILIDECVPWKLGRHLLGHECEGVARAGFTGQKNGALLTSAERAGYDALLTVDQGLEYEQSLKDLKIILIVIRAQSNKIEALLPHLQECLRALRSAGPGTIVRVG